MYFYSINQSSANKWDITITGYLAGFKVGESSGTFEIKDNLYQLNMKSSTTGITKIIYPWVQTIAVTGKIVNGNLIPISYKIDDYRDDNKKGHMYINYTNNIPKIISAKPDALKDSRRQVVPHELTINSVDPVTSIIVLGTLSSLNECNTKIAIYDGRRRFNLKYNNVEKDENTLLCKLKIQRIAGYSKKELAKHPKSGEIKLSIIDKNNSFYFPVEVKVPLSIGSFFVTLNANLIME